MFLLIPPSLKSGHFDQSSFIILHSTILNVVLKFQYSDQLLIFQSNSNNLIDFHFCNRISTFDQTPLFRSNFNIFIDLTFCTQISTLWSISTLLHTNVNFLIDSPLFTHNTSFWTIWWLALKFQHFDRFLTLSSNFNIRINSLFFNQIPIICNRISTFDQSPLFRSNLNILINLTFCTQISTFWCISTLLHSNINFLIDSPLFTQNTIFWTIWWLALKFQHFDWFPILSSISIFWSIPYFAIKFQHFDRFTLWLKNISILIDFDD